MATKVNVRGKLIQRPGVYATVKSGIKNAPTAQSYGNILIIDDGIGAGFGGGSGITGTLKTGSDSVYSFDTIQDFQAFVKGGELWNLAKPLFKPSKNQPGVSKIFFVRAATTAPASFTKAFTNGSITIQTKDEGLNANGVLVSTNLTQGYGYKLIADPNISGNFLFQIFAGTYKGMDSANGISYDGVLPADAKPTLVAQSPSVLAISDLVAWLNTSPEILGGFKLTASTATGNFVVGDVSSTYGLFSGGTETYNATDFDAALGVINNLDFTHILAMKYGSNATSLNNTKIRDFIVNDSKYDRIMVVAGAADKTLFATGTNSSGTTAAFFNSDQVVTVHGSVKKNFRANPNGFNIYSQLYHAAQILGRVAGLPSQVPVTYKSIDIDGLVHQLSDAEQETAITKGIITSIYNYELEAFVVTLDVNTLQSNNYLVNDDGTTYNWALKRIEADLNKSIVINGMKRFFDPNGLGGNRNTTSPEDVVNWAEGYLKSRTASDLKDDILIRAQNIQAILSQDNIQLSYEFVGNTEVKTIVSTGTLIEG